MPNKALHRGAKSGAPVSFVGYRCFKFEIKRYACSRRTRPMSSEQNNKDVLREWREAAPYWAKHADIVRSMFAPITRALIEAGGITEGQEVLDVAGGAGEPSITISPVV